MKVTGGLLSKAGADTDDSSLSRHYMCCLINIYTNGKVDDGKENTAGKKIRRRYEQKQRSAVKWLSGSQIFLGLLILGCQIAPSYYIYSLRSAAQQVDWLRIAQYYMPMLDVVFPGVWAGIIILLTGIVGLVAASKNARCLIVAHLVLNSFVILCALVAAVIGGISLGRIVDCKVNGSEIRIRSYDSSKSYRTYNRYDNGHRFYDSTGTLLPTTTTASTTLSPVVVWGEEFTWDRGNNQKFYCTNNAFTVWIVMELVIALSGLVAFGLTIGLIAKNSKALSLCCRRCCTVEEEIEGKADDASLLRA